jgi:hypothetical protein
MPHSRYAHASLLQQVHDRHKPRPQLPLLPDDASNLLGRMLEAKLPPACAALRVPGSGGASAAVVMRTVAQLVTIAAEAGMMTPEAAAKLTDVAWRWPFMAFRGVFRQAFIQYLCANQS